jgi:hypothetical protein
MTAGRPPEPPGPRDDDDGRRRRAVWIALVLGLLLIAAIIGAILLATGDDDEDTDADGAVTARTTTAVTTDGGTDGAVPPTTTTGGEGGTTTSSADREGLFSGRLQPVNGSGVTGTVRIGATEDGRLLAVRLDATGLEFGGAHPVHIHEPDGQDARVACPGPDADADGDGIVSLAEGEPSYGPVRVEFAPPPPVDSSGTMTFRGQLRVEDRSIVPVTDGAVVVHGLSVEGEYDPTVPVACAVLSPA